MTLIAGCHSDAEQSVEIQSKMANAISHEEDFRANYDDLKTYREKEQSIYHDIIKSDIQDNDDSIQQKLDNAAAYLNKQKDLINKAREHFQDAYEQVLTIEKNIEKIEDEKQKKQATKILTVMKDRRDQMASFFDNYQDQLQRLGRFYDQLQHQDDPFHIEELEKEIQTINDHNHDMKDTIQQFNQKTGVYNETKKNYYKMAKDN